MTVEVALRQLGYWYPPDAIAAVREGRDSYHPLDPAIAYRLSQCARAVIRQAITMAEPEPRLEWLP